MKAIWRGENDELGLLYGKEYKIFAYDADLDCYAVFDEVGGPYLYPVEDFEITQKFPLPLDYEEDEEDEDTDETGDDE